GISGLNGTLVRAKFQKNPPPQPSDIDTNWIGFSLNTITQDGNAYVGMDEDDVMNLQRQELIEVQCSIYGALASETAGKLSDGFQIQQNLEALRLAKMGYVGIGPQILGPDLI